MVQLLGPTFSSAKVMQPFSLGMETVHKHIGEEVMGGDTCDEMSIGAHSKVTMGTNKHRVYSHRFMPWKNLLLLSSIVPSYLQNRIPGG